MLFRSGEILGIEEFKNGTLDGKSVYYYKNGNIHQLKKDEITKRREKCEMHTEGPGIWRETENQGN